MLVNNYLLVSDLVDELSSIKMLKFMIVSSNPFEKNISKLIYLYQNKKAFNIFYISKNDLYVIITC